MYGSPTGPTSADLGAVLDIEIGWELVLIEDRFGEPAVDDLVTAMARGHMPSGVIHDFWAEVHETANVTSLQVNDSQCSARVEQRAA